MSSANVNDSPGQLNRLLRMAVTAGVESAVRIHIERGDDLNARDANSMTPLMLSAARNKPSICRLLLNAGADHSLLDSSGKTALEIAIAAGSEATAMILGAAQAPISSVATPQISLGSEPNAIGQTSARLAALAGETKEATTQPPEPLVEPPALEPEHAAVLTDSMDDGEFDLSEWAVEEEPTRPEADLVVLHSASAVQTVITSHQPIDSSAEWDDIDAYLPEQALPLARADDAEGRGRLRRLLLRALREGSVPRMDVQDQSTNEDRSNNAEAEAYLAMIINDLGAEVDERFEHYDAIESGEVFVDPEETIEEEATLDEALGAIDCGTTPRHEPLRIYQREFQRRRLLTSDEEIELSKRMEAALDAALDSLAAWPEGIKRTRMACEAVMAGRQALSSICACSAESNPAPASSENLKVDVPANEESDDAFCESGEQEEDVAESTDTSQFSDAFRNLVVLVTRSEGHNASNHEIRRALAALHLSRSFLLELTTETHGAAPCNGFLRAMTAFRDARDAMAMANLKLAFFHAKKFIYTGEPLDDLTQEANIGLLKAVDRFDWRRGFRFSTYATWWIRQSISRYIADKGRTIRLPVHVFEKAQRAEREARSFTSGYGREPTVDELAQRMQMPASKLATLLRIPPEPLRLDEVPIDEMIAADTRAAMAAPDPADVVAQTQLNRAVDRWLASTWTEDRKSERVLRLRFGIGVNEALTLEAVGQHFGVTRERIRQVEAKAIRTLRHLAHSETFARLALGIIQPSETTEQSDTPNRSTARRHRKRRFASHASLESDRSARFTDVSASTE